MDTQNQFLIFCFCILIGFTGGIIYEIFSIIRLILRVDCKKIKILSVILDLLFCLFFAIFCVFAAYLLHFPAFRIYMWIGYLCGLCIYLKILHRILAFLEKLCYNTIIKIVKGTKRRKALPKGGKEL